MTLTSCHNFAFYVGKTRLDTDGGLKTSYRSRSGRDVRVVVNAPVISNPRPSASAVSWTGPMTANIQSNVGERGGVIYKHWIISTIPVIDQTYFGNYTMRYNRQNVVTITVESEGL
jgi:hypothetical protein